MCQVYLKLVSGSGEKDKNAKIFTTTTSKGQVWSKVLTWAFSSVELNLAYNICKIKSNLFFFLNSLLLTPWHQFAWFYFFNSICNTRKNKRFKTAKLCEFCTDFDAFFLQWFPIYSVFNLRKELQQAKYLVAM